MSSHSCSVNRCRGQKFNGLKLKCTDCNEETYIECMINRTEINELMKSLNSVNTITAMSPSTAEQQNKLNVMFNDDSLFSFKCIKCKIALNEMIINNDSRKNQLEDLSMKNAELHQEIEKLKETINEMNNHATLDDEMSQNDKTFTEQIETKLKDFSKDLMDRVKSDIESMKNSIMSSVNEVTKRKTSENNKAKNQTDEQPNANTQTPRNSRKQNSVQFESPMPPNETRNKKKSVYEMYVSKFELGTQTETIINRIKNMSVV